MATVQDFREYIKYTKSKAADQGLEFVELSAEGIHLCVAGASNGTSFMALCHEAMEAERGPADKALEPRNGHRKNLTILYAV